MSNATKLILGALALIITAILVSYTMKVANTGKDLFDRGQAQLSDSLESLPSSQYATLDGSVQTGSEVIRVINSTIHDDSIEVLVCTADGQNFVYNRAGKAIYGTTDADGDNYSSEFVTVLDTTAGNYLSGQAQYDAQGKAFAGGGTGTQAKIRRATRSGHVLSGESDNSFTCIDSGYNSSVPMDSLGYIAANASFDCTMQADLNGETRRLTFVQR